MRNLIIAAVIFASASSMFVYERKAMAEAHVRARRLANESASLDGRISHQKERIGNLEGRRAAQIAELKVATENFEQERTAHTNIAVETLTPQIEGEWPRTRPYFYLSKKHIPFVGYAALTMSGRVSAEAAALFGMSPAERRVIDDSMQTLLARVREREIREAYLTNTPPNVESQRKGEKISVFVPGNSQVKELTDEFARAVKEALGPGRAEHFLDKVQNLHGELDNMTEQDRVVTLIRKDENTGEIIVSEGHGLSFTPYDLTREDQMSVEYGHLLDMYLP